MTHIYSYKECYRQWQNCSQFFTKTQLSRPGFGQTIIITTSRNVSFCQLCAHNADGQQQHWAVGVGAAAAAAGGGGGGGGVVHRPRRERRGSLYAPGTLLLLLPTSRDTSKTFWRPTTKDEIINQSHFWFFCKCSCSITNKVVWNRMNPKVLPLSHVLDRMCLVYKHTSICVH